MNSEYTRAKNMTMHSVRSPIKKNPTYNLKIEFHTARLITAALRHLSFRTSARDSHYLSAQFKSKTKASIYSYSSRNAQETCSAAAI